jgi:hypothetical protein
MRLIPLTRGKFAQVDDEDYEWLMEYNWQARHVQNVWYAACRQLGYMHRAIAERYGFLIKFVDHKDIDGLNNQKQNLRQCTKRQNQQNQRKRHGCSSQYKGVCVAGTKWGASIRVNGKRIHLSYYDDEIEAARVYDRAAIEYFGAFAKINFPVTDYALAC